MQSIILQRLSKDIVLMEYIKNVGCKMKCHDFIGGLCRCSGIRCYKTAYKGLESHMQRHEKDSDVC